jgi:hypothetical protein
MAPLKTTIPQVDLSEDALFRLAVLDLVEVVVDRLRDRPLPEALAVLDRWRRNLEQPR